MTWLNKKILTVCVSAKTQRWRENEGLSEIHGAQWLIAVCLSANPKGMMGEGINLQRTSWGMASLILDSCTLCS